MKLRSNVINTIYGAAEQLINFLILPIIWEAHRWILRHGIIM